jgi:hypothetical protein
MVSAVYKTADASEYAYPSKHSTGRVCDEIEPTPTNGPDRVGVERSLSTVLVAPIVFFFGGERTKIGQSCLNLPTRGDRVKEIQRTS